MRARWPDAQVLEFHPHQLGGTGLTRRAARRLTYREPFEHPPVGRELDQRAVARLGVAARLIGELRSVMRDGAGE